MSGGSLDVGDRIVEPLRKASVTPLLGCLF
jgi:hypothetical protein